MVDRCWEQRVACEDGPWRESEGEGRGARPKTQEGKMVPVAGLLSLYSQERLPNSISWGRTPRTGATAHPGRKPPLLLVETEPIPFNFPPLGPRVTLHEPVHDARRHACEVGFSIGLAAAAHIHRRQHRHRQEHPDARAEGPVSNTQLCSAELRACKSVLPLTEAERVLQNPATSDPRELCLSADAGLPTSRLCALSTSPSPSGRSLACSLPCTLARSRVRPSSSWC